MTPAHAPDNVLRPPVGLLDDPAHQRQAPLQLDLARDGHLAVFGAPSTGKSELLHTLVFSLAQSHSRADLHLYLLDFGGQLMTTFNGLPHLGGVILAEEEEKLVRLLRHLSHELARRKVLFGTAGVATLPAHRATASTPLPGIVVVVDNLPALVNTYPDLEDQLAVLAQQGGTYGIHLVISAASPTFVRLKLSTSFSQVVALRLAAGPTDRGRGWCAHCPNGCR